VEKETKHSIVIKSNSLIDAVYKMPVNSAHLFSIMLRHIIANNIITDNGQLHTITAAEYGTLLGIDKKNQYRELKIATKFLLSAIIKVPLTKDKYREYSIFDIAEYAIGYGYTSLAFSRNFLPLIQDLHADYTRLKLAETLRLKSFASIRIYEKLMQYRQADDSGWWRVEMDELKEFLGVDLEHIYWENKYFNIKIFNPAIYAPCGELYWENIYYLIPIFLQ
jgi:plasmid replication initiation protein